MKRCLCLVFCVFVFILGFSFSAFCIENKEEIINESEEKLFSSIDSETKDILNDLGVTGLDFDSINNVSLESIIDYFSDDFKSKITTVIKFTLTLGAVIVLTSVITLTADGQNKDIIELAAVATVIVLSVSSLNSTVNVILSVIDASSKFMLSYIPIFTALIAFSGSAATALSYNTLLLSVSELISKFISAFAIKITGSFFALSIGFSLSRNISLSRFTSFYSRTTTLIIGFLSSLFASFLTVKGVFSSAVDTVSVKGLRFIISSMIPVVGSAISDAYSTVLGSIDLVKGSVAVVGILVFVIINLPTLFEGVCYCLSFNFLSLISDTVNSERTSALLKAFSVAIKCLLLIQVFLMFILIVSTAVMVNVKSNV